MRVVLFSRYWISFPDKPDYLAIQTLLEFLSTTKKIVIFQKEVWEPKKNMMEIT